MIGVWAFGLRPWGQVSRAGPEQCIGFVGVELLLGQSRCGDRRDPLGARIRRTCIRGDRPRHRMARRVSRNPASKRGKTVVRTDPVYFRPTEVDLLIGDASKARQKLGWESKTSLAQRGEFLYDNLIIAANVIHAAHVNGAEKLMFPGSSCICPPRLVPQPLREDSILTGPLESTNEPYAIAKIAGIKMVEAYRSQYGSDFINVMPTNIICTEPVTIIIPSTATSSPR